MTNIDPYFYKFEGTGFPGHYQKIPLDNDFNAYLLCDTSQQRYIFIYTDRKEFGLSSERDSKDVRRLFTGLYDRLSDCEKANDLFTSYEDELHLAHTIKIGDQDIPIYRIRKASLRLYLVFLGSDVIFFRLSVKRQKKISESEKNILNNRVKAIFTYPANSDAFKERLL